MINLFFPAGDTCRQSGSVPLLRRQAQPKKYRKNILHGFRLFKKFQCVLEKQEHFGRTILRNAKRFNKPDTVHKHAQPIPVVAERRGPRIRLLSCKERYMPIRVVLVLIWSSLKDSDSHRIVCGSGCRQRRTPIRYRGGASAYAARGPIPESALPPKRGPYRTIP